MHNTKRHRESIKITLCKKTDYTQKQQLWEFLLCNSRFTEPSPSLVAAQVWSPAQSSELRIRCRCSCSIGCSCSADSIPGLGTSICHSAAKTKKQTKNKKNKQKKKQRLDFQLASHSTQRKAKREQNKIFKFLREITANLRFHTQQKHLSRMKLK